MADVTLTYKGATIAELSASGSKTLETAGKYCEADIELAYTKPSGGSPWELIADTTSDAIATVVTAEIPSAYQTENVYKVQISVEFTGNEYPYFGINASFSPYDIVRSYSTPWVFIGYVVNREINGTPSYVFNISTKTLTTGINTVGSISLKSYYENHIKAGCNIKVWRLVE